MQAMLSFNLGSSFPSAEITDVSPNPGNLYSLIYNEKYSEAHQIKCQSKINSQAQLMHFYFAEELHALQRFLGSVTMKMFNSEVNSGDLKL